MKKNIKKGDLCILTYQDASFLYSSPVRSGIFLPPEPTMSIGKIRAINANYIDIAYTWDKDSPRVQDGIIIPKRTIIALKKLYEKKGRR